MSKRPCHPPKPTSCDTFDIILRPLYPSSKSEMPVCVEIRPNIVKQVKDYTLSLIVVADISGSMLEGNKMYSMREGIARLGELTGRFSTIKTDFTLIEFNDAARLVHTSSSVPSSNDLRRICSELWPCGGTNIGAALKLAMEYASKKQAVHVAIFTDGHDGCDLQSKLDDEGAQEFAALRTLPNFWMHCVGVGDDFDNRLLDTISRTARRGTFQSIQDENIGRLMGALWGLMMEAVDLNCALSIEIDGKPIMERKELALRICDPPMACRVIVQKVQPNTRKFTATFFVGTEAKSRHIRFSSSEEGETTEDEGGSCHMDEVCASEAISEIEARAFAQVATALSASDFDEAHRANCEALRSIQRLFSGELPPAVKTTFAMALQTLGTQSEKIAKGRNNHGIAKEAEMRAMSRSSTDRNYGVSIDPESQSLSELQSQLSEC